VTFELLKNYIWFASGQKKPHDSVIGEKQKPIGKLLDEISEMKESKRNTPFFNHLSAIAEGINAITWINVVSFTFPCLIAKLVTYSGTSCERNERSVYVFRESCSHGE
jgi:hypothetical protein